MEITGYGTIENITNDAEILITTRDFKTTGKITFYDGVLTWGEIETTDTVMFITISQIAWERVSSNLPEYSRTWFDGSLPFAKRFITTKRITKSAFV